MGGMCLASNDVRHDVPVFRNDLTSFKAFVLCIVCEDGSKYIVKVGMPSVLFRLILMKRILLFHSMKSIKCILNCVVRFSCCLKNLSHL